MPHALMRQGIDFDVAQHPLVSCTDNIGAQRCCITGPVPPWLSRWLSGDSFRICACVHSVGSVPPCIEIHRGTAFGLT